MSYVLYRWCALRGKNIIEKHTNKEKRMLRHWFQQLDYDGKNAILFIFYVFYVFYVFLSDSSTLFMSFYLNLLLYLYVIVFLSDSSMPYSIYMLYMLLSYSIYVF
jgi:hypothetical protein